jgi:hypothetical protein
MTTAQPCRAPLPNLSRLQTLPLDTHIDSQTPFLRQFDKPDQKDQLAERITTLSLFMHALPKSKVKLNINWTKDALLNMGV